MSKGCLFSVERVANCLVVAENLVGLKCFEVAFSPTGMFVLVPDEVWLVYQVVIRVGLVFILDKLLSHRGLVLEGGVLPLECGNN